MKKKQITLLISIVLGVVLLGILSGFPVKPNLDNWYSTLQKPFFQPPNFIFGPVWTVLYVLMGYGLYRIYKQPKTRARVWAIGSFYLQFVFNLLWSFLFFSCHYLLLSVLDIVALWLSIIAMMVLFYRVEKTAALLQIPYFLWVSFASILNIWIWWHNS